MISSPDVRFCHWQMERICWADQNIIPSKRTWWWKVYFTSYKITYWNWFIETVKEFSLKRQDSNPDSLIINPIHLTLLQVSFPRLLSRFSLGGCVGVSTIGKTCPTLCCLLLTADRTGFQLYEGSTIKKVDIGSQWLGAEYGPDEKKS